MLKEFLTPVQLDHYIDPEQLSPAQWGRIVSFQPESEEAQNDTIDLALVGVREDRASVGNAGSASMPDHVRKHLYQLYGDNERLRLFDLGDIQAGNTVHDTYAAIRQVVEELLHQNIIPILIGGSHDLTFGQYHGYQHFDQFINLVNVDERIDIGEVDDAKEIDASNFLLPMFIEQPNFLFNFSHIGYQTYFVEPKAIETLEQLNFDCYRLGRVRYDIEKVEPIVRDADLLSFDISAIRQSDAMATPNPTPHGFFGEEACQIAWYAGLSDKMSSFGLYGGNPAYDQNNITAQLMAHMIWYFVEGFYNRKQDKPVVDAQNFFKYLVKMEELDHELIFYKSKKSGRWWIQLPQTQSEYQNKDALPHFMPCTYEEYEAACREELPERWLRAYHKLV